MNKHITRIIASALAIAFWFSQAAQGADVPDMAIIRPEVQTGFVNAGWKYDRYPELPPLDAHKAVDREGTVPYEP